MQKDNARRLIVIGATGALGAPLCAALLRRGDSLVVFSRDPVAAQQRVPGAMAYVAWQPEESGAWEAHLGAADGVIYLAGKSIYTEPHTEQDVHDELQTRMRGINGVVRAMEAAHGRSAVLISASSVGTYGYAGPLNAELTETSAPGEDFWGRISVLWEAAALTARQFGVRVVLPRPGFVLTPQPDGGLMRQVGQFRAGYGGPVEPGTQWSPWIHIADSVGLLLLALDDARVHGPLNVVAPSLVRNHEFAATLALHVGQAATRMIPAGMLRQHMGIVADTITHGRRVLPALAQALDYHFQFPRLDGALQDLVPASTASTSGWGAANWQAGS
jgi:uncharacterized protein (TIGR01777 family)